MSGVGGVVGVPSGVGAVGFQLGGGAWTGWVGRAKPIDHALGGTPKRSIGLVLGQTHGVGRMFLESAAHTVSPPRFTRSLTRSL